ncbi:MAG: leucine-rich repeat domain-containing protein [[Clostridium] fimetarium]|nr:leucine-rich repeat domain-containing protein [Alistipes timonensis]MCM1405353.1 leucine-rich repeat domain-containing protein [[Clostridium] fimetarium]
MKTFTLKSLLCCAAMVAAGSAASAQELLRTLFYNGVYYEQTDELRVKLIASPAEKYSGTLSIPNFFNITSIDAEGKPVVTSYFVTEVADGAFEGCDALREVTFNGATVKFGRNAFKGCTRLRKFDFPSSFAADTEIGEGAFEGCESLGEVSFGNRVAPIPARAFAGCTDLTDITIAAPEPPAVAADAFDAATLASSVVYVPKSAVAAYRGADGWKGFKSIDAISEYSFVKDGVYYLVDEMNSKKCKVTLDGYGSYTGEVVIPEYVTNNGITYTVAEIGKDAFRGSAGLTKVTIPESVYNLGINAFQGCTSLEEITLPASVGSLPDELFRDCSALKSFVCPPNLGVIRQSVFRGCSSLESVEFSPEVYIIGAYAFADCVSLRKFNAPEKMNMIGNYAFLNCTGLDEVTGVPGWTYWYAEGSFAGCDNIRYINIPVPEPPRCPKENMFSQAVYDNATLIVPAGSVGAYQASVHGDNDTPDVWQLFKHVISSTTGVDTLPAESETAAPARYFNLQGVEVANPEKGGLYIRLSGDHAEKVVF